MSIPTTLRTASAFTSAFASAFSLGTIPALAGLPLALLETTRAVLPSTLGRRWRIGFAFETFGLPDLNGTLDEAFEGTQRVPVVSGDERDCNPVHIGPAGPADPVNVILGVGGKVKVHYVGDPVDVDPTGGNVGGDQDADFAILEILQGPGPLVLAPVGVNGTR